MTPRPRRSANVSGAAESGEGALTERRLAGLRRPEVRSALRRRVRRASALAWDGQPWKDAGEDEIDEAEGAEEARCDPKLNGSDPGSPTTWGEGRPHEKVSLEPEPEHGHKADAAQDHRGFLWPRPEQHPERDDPA